MSDYDRYADVIKDHESYMPFPGDTIRIKMKKGNHFNTYINY